MLAALWFLVISLSSLHLQAKKIMPECIITLLIRQSIFTQVMLVTSLPSFVLRKAVFLAMYVPEEDYSIVLETLATDDNLNFGWKGKKLYNNVQQPTE